MPPPYNKQYLLNQLDNTSNTFVLGLVGATLLSDRKVLAGLPEQATFEILKVRFVSVLPLLFHPTDAPLAISEFLKLLFRALLKESFEHIKAYSRHVGRFDKMRQAPWYDFARLIRNCLTHDGRFRFNKGDIRVLPVTWHGKCLDCSMTDQEMRFDFFDTGDGWALFHEMRSWAEAELA